MISELSGKALHNSDLVLWAVRSAELLRDGRALETDEREQIAEELDGIASSTRRELRSCTVSLLVHLLKVEFQRERHSRSWGVTVANQRRELHSMLEESPSLLAVLEQELGGLYESARFEAQVETGLDVFLAANPFTVEQMLRIA